LRATRPVLPVKRCATLLLFALQDCHLLLHHVQLFLPSRLIMSESLRGDVMVSTGLVKKIIECFGLELVNCDPAFFQGFLKEFVFLVFGRHEAAGSGQKPGKKN
jgi:hypothetical protein